MSRSRARWLWRAANGLSSPTLLVALTAMVFVWATVRDVSSVRRRAGRLGEDVMRFRVELAAETALFRHADLADGAAHDEIAGVDVDLRCSGGEVLLACRDGRGVVTEFSASSLAGGAPAALAHERAATTVDALAVIGDGVRLAPGELPRLDEQAVAAAPRANELRGFRRDPGVALAALPVGTDREDYVWFDGAPDGGVVPADGLLVVGGNLWLPPRDGAFEVHLDRDLVVLVLGNAYLRSHLRVVGGGRLLMVAANVAGDVAYADVDASGTWSEGEAVRDAPRFRGAVEGCGMVFVGAGGGGEPLHLDAGLVVMGELHLLAGAAVAGPLIVHHGVTCVGGEGARCGGARWTFRPGRERVPGFAVSGPPRPGRLRRLGR